MAVRSINHNVDALQKLSCRVYIAASSLRRVKEGLLALYKFKRANH